MCDRSAVADIKKQLRKIITNDEFVGFSRLHFDGINDYDLRSESRFRLLFNLLWESSETELVSKSDTSELMGDGLDGCGNT